MTIKIHSCEIMSMEKYQKMTQGFSISSIGSAPENCLVIHYSEKTSTGLVAEGHKLFTFTDDAEEINVLMDIMHSMILKKNKE